MIPKYYLVNAEEWKFSKRNEGGWIGMNEKELVWTFRLKGDGIGNLLPTEINRIFINCAEQVNRAAGKAIVATGAYDFDGKHHTVTLKEPVAA